MKKPPIFPSRVRRSVLGLIASLPLLAVASDVQRPASPPRAPRAELGTAAAFAPDGRLLVAYKEGGHVVLRASSDEGASWSDPVRVNAQPEAIAADGESRPHLGFGAQGSVLVSWAKPLNKPYTGEIRFARSVDGGRHFDGPQTVHHDASEITHRFESFSATPDGRVLVAWIDKRDQEAAKAARRPYAGAAIYAALSTDDGLTFNPEFKLADHSCECCRTSVVNDRDGMPLVFWRHVFDNSERDHALLRIGADGKPGPLQRATFDRWQIAACPHHGPSLAIDAQGARHAVWFNHVGGEGRVFYGRLDAAGGKPLAQRALGGPLAAHADLAVSGKRVAVVWKEFDGERTLLRGELSEDGGETFRPLELAGSSGSSDQPRVLSRGGDLFVFWRTDKEGLRLYPLTK